MARLESQIEVESVLVEPTSEAHPPEGFTDACPENSKAGPEVTEAAVEQQELRKEEADVDNIGSLGGRYDDHHLVVRSSRRRKKRTQGNGGLWKKLADNRRRIMHRAVPTVRRKRPGGGSLPKEKAKKTDTCGEETTEGARTQK
jgi:hypothetical protein